MTLEDLVRDGLTREQQQELILGAARILQKEIRTRSSEDHLTLLESLIERGLWSFGREARYQGEDGASCLFRDR